MDLQGPELRRPCKHKELRIFRIMTIASTRQPHSIEFQVPPNEAQKILIELGLEGLGKFKGFAIGTAMSFRRVSTVGLTRLVPPR